MTYTTPDNADVTMRVVVFERAADGSPGYRIFHGRKVSVSPKSTMYEKVAPDGTGFGGFSTELIPAGDVLTEEPIREED